MITHDDAVAPDLDRSLRVGHTLDALQAKRSPAADALPRADQPGEFLPAPRAAVPDAVDPHCPGLVRLRDGIDPCFFQPLLEYWVAQAQVGADAVVESVVACGDVIVPPAQLPRIRRQDAGVKPRFPRAGQEGNRELVIVRHVELVEAGTVAVGRADGFDGRGACGREAVGQVELFGNGCDGEFTERVVDFVYADGGEANGCGD